MAIAVQERRTQQVRPEPAQEPQSTNLDTAANDVQEPSAPDSSTERTNEPNAADRHPDVQAWKGQSTFVPTAGSGAIDPSAPFTGSGATGNVAPGNVPLASQGAMAIDRVADPGNNLRRGAIAVEDAAYEVGQSGRDAAASLRDGAQTIRNNYGDIAGTVADKAAAIAGSVTTAVTAATEWGMNRVADGLDAGGKVVNNTINALKDPYLNPVGDSDAYLKGLSGQERIDQARTLLEQPINTSDPSKYPNGLPSRADVVRDAAKRYNLDPSTVAGVLLAEQRDQSRLEDEKDIAAATNPIFNANTSIGLGQVTVGTAMKDNANLLRDTVTAQQRGKLSHSDVARLLQNDDTNIYATARYIRRVADMGAATDPSKLPTTQSTYKNIDMTSYARNSRNWTRNQIEALGSEYTSKPWDDEVFEYWGRFVAEGVNDVRRAGVF